MGTGSGWSLESFTGISHKMMQNISCNFRTLLNKVKAVLLASCLVSLVPWVSAQDLPNPTRWENEMAAFDALDAANTPLEGAIVLTGSSSIRLWKDPAADLAPLTVIQRGFGGSVMGDLLYYLDRTVLRYKPRAVVIYEGDNDTALNISTDTILDQLRQIISRIHGELPETRIYLLAAKPSVLRWEIFDHAQVVNAGYQLIADSDPQVYYIDTVTPFLEKNGVVMDDIFVSDNLHLNDTGYLIWSSTIRAALMPNEIRVE